MKKNVRRSLVMSLVAMMLCIAMMAGSTVAWFTDSVVSGNNIIKTGTLDIEMGWADGTQAVPTTKDGWDDASSGAIFNYDLWEPGYTEVRHIQIENVGTLALKYQLEIAAEGEVTELADVIDVYYLDPAQAIASRDQLPAQPIGTLSQVLAGMGDTASGVLLPGEGALNVTIALKMQEAAGNEYQDMSIGSSFAVKLFATQYTYEEDSFDNMYDEEAEWPAVVATSADLKNALANAPTEATIVLDADVVVDSKIEIAAGKNITLDLNGNELAGAFATQGASAVIENKGNLTITNGTVVSLAEFPDVDWGTEGFPTYATNTISNRGNLVIGEGAVIENETNVGGASYAIDNYAGASLTINEGAKVVAKDVAIRMFTNSATADCNVVINGGSITGKRAVWIQLPSSNAAVAPKANLTINGGELTGDSGLAIYSYSYGNSFANTNVTITAGTFNGDVQFGGGYKGDVENVTITGGTFNGYLGRWLVNDGWADIAKP